MIQMNLFTKQKEKDLEKELTVSRGRMGKGIVRKFGMDVYTSLYFKWITNKNLLYTTWNYAQCYAAAWMAGEFGREWIYVYVWLSPFAVHLKPSQQC